MGEHVPLRIAICVKQVPMASALRFESDTLRLKREGVPLELNSCDIRAVVGLVDRVAAGELSAELIAVTMGPASAQKALAHCLALGCDRAVHLSDPAFAGSDTLATARTLAAAIKTLDGVRLVVCGRASTDAETGHVGPQLAELLGWRQITAVRELTTVNAGVLRASRDIEGVREAVELAPPAVVTIGEDFAPERYPSRESRDAVDLQLVQTLCARDIGLEEGRAGAAGSPTAVAGLTEVSVSRQCEMLDTSTSTERQAGEIARFVAERVNGTPPCRASRGSHVALPAAACADGAGVWVVADSSPRRLPDATFELLGKAQTLCRAIGGHVAAVLLGPDPARFAKPVAEHGADLALTLSGPPPRFATLDAYVDALVDAIRAERPRTVLFASQSTTGELAPRIAARLELGITADCVDLSIEGGTLIQHKPAFGDAVVALITSSTQPEMATVRPGMFAKPVAEPRRVIDVRALPTAGLEAMAQATMRNGHSVGDTADAAGLADAPVVIGVGMGLGGPELLVDVDRLAEHLGAVVGCTRRVADEGWLPRHKQIGLTGTAIAPRLYLDRKSVV